MRETIALAIALLAGIAASLPASAHGPRGRVHFGIHLGVPVWYYPAWYYPAWYYPAWYYPPPYYYYPPVVVHSAPPVYVERPAEPAPSSDSAGWWYYCEQSRGYYPYVKTCPGGWQRVPPAPTPAGG
ncbi:MAG: hypothetical protein ACT4P4_10885 [Betaproteobacteria bacterium]